MPDDFEKFDLILAMDRSNRNALLKLAPLEHRGKIRLFLNYAPNLPVQEVPDPFFGNADGFEYVCQLVDSACRGLLLSLTSQKMQTQEPQTASAANPVLPSSVPANGYSASTR